MTRKEFNDTVSNIVKKMGLSHWEDNPAGVVHCMSTEILEMCCGEYSLTDDYGKLLPPDHKWHSGWVKACEQELIDRIVLK